MIFRKSDYNKGAKFKIGDVVRVLHRIEEKAKDDCCKIGPFLVTREKGRGGYGITIETLNGGINMGERNPEAFYLDPFLTAAKNAIDSGGESLDNEIMREEEGQGGPCKAKS